MTPAHWLGLLAIVALPLFIRHVQYRANEAEGDRVSSAWLRDNR